MPRGYVQALAKETNDYRPRNNRCPDCSGVQEVLAPATPSFRHPPRRSYRINRPVTLEHLMPAASGGSSGAPLFSMKPDHRPLLARGERACSKMTGGAGIANVCLA